MIMSAFSRLPAMVCVVLAVASAGCSSTSTCSRDPDAITVTDGIVTGNRYISGPFGGPYVYFPPARTITFEHDLKEHGFAEPPYDEQIWLAFSPNGTLAEAAGNEAELVQTADGGNGITNETITVYNDTCSTFYIWLVATAPSDVTAASDGGDTESAAAGAAGTTP
jgi:hypothetical protein